jgi:uncharacterized protein (TIGR00290 family)
VSDAVSRHGGTDLALAWSGGKDSALALRALRAAGREPAMLLTTVTEGYDRVTMHGVRRELLRRQAAAAGLELVEIGIPPGCTDALYDERMAQAFASLPLAGVVEVAFGDLFLEDVRAYREERLARAGRRALFPLWGRGTCRLAEEFVGAGFRALVVSVDPRQIDLALAGRLYDDAFLAELPAGVDPCGERGEFHTFVFAGPVLSRPIPVRPGKAIERDGFVYCDLLPVDVSGESPVEQVEHGLGGRCEA